MAIHYLPQLKEGDALPDCLVLPKHAPSGAGCFTSGPTSYTFSCSRVDGDLVVLFRPAPQTALTGAQLEGALEQLRTLWVDFLPRPVPWATPGEKTSACPLTAFAKGSPGPSG